MSRNSDVDEPAFLDMGGIVGVTLLIPAAGLALLTVGYTKTPFDEIFEEVSAEERVGADLLRAIAKQESGLNPEAVSPINANGTRDFGIMQINERTAQTFGYTGLQLVTSRKNPDRAIVKRGVVIAARLLKAVARELREKTSYYAMIAAYNAGAPRIYKAGIFNWAYVASVASHHQLYILGSFARKGTA